MNENGFMVNTDVKVKPKKKKARRKAQRTLILGVAVILLLAIAAVIFCATVPVYSVKVLDYRVMEGADDNTQIDYYDENGNIIKMVYYNKGVENGYTTITYDKDGNVLKKESFYEGMLATIDNYVYEGGRLVKLKNLTPGNVVSSTIYYEYNHDGTVTMELVYDGEGNITAQYNHTYENGVRTKTTLVYLSNNYTETITYAYENGNVVTETRTSDRSEKVTSYTYDNSGNMLSKNVKGGEYVVYKYTYKTIKVPVFDR